MVGELAVVPVALVGAYSFDDDAEGGVGVHVLDRQMAVAFVAYSAAGNKWVFLSAVSVV